MTPSEETLPLLYSFRRCPYAIRARMALAYSGIPVELREVRLRDKPDEMTRLSPKGTVPVLVLPDGKVIDESIDVMHWALDRHDPEDWRGGDTALTTRLIEENDGPFKDALDRYKYSTRFPEHPREHYRSEGERFLHKLEVCLGENEGAGLVRGVTGLADVAIFPFVRQFSGADPGWFSAARYPLLKQWLEQWVNDELFLRVMRKYLPWGKGDEPVIEGWRLA